MNPPASLASRTFGILRRQFFALVGAAFWPYLGLIALFAVARLIISTLRTPHLSTDPEQLWRSYSVLSKIGVIVAFIATASFPWGLSTSGVSLLVCREERGNPMSMREVMTHLMRRLPALLALSFVLGTALTIMSALFFLPGLIAVAVGYPAMAAFANESLGVGKALKRGSQVALARLGTIIVLVILFCLVSNFLVLGTALVMARQPAPSDSALTFVMWGFIAIVPPVLILLVAPAMALLYRDVYRELPPSPANEPSPLTVSH